MFFIRRGRLIGRESFVLDGTSTEQQGELVAAFVKQFYSEAAYVPDQILLPQSIEERQIIQEWLRSKRGGRKVTVLAPKQGAKRQLVEMAAENAAATLTTLQAQWQADTNRQTEGLTQLQGGAGPERAAQPDRVLRHLHAAGHQHRGQHGGFRQGGAVQERLPAV